MILLFLLRLCTFRTSDKSDLNKCHTTALFPNLNWFRLEVVEVRLDEETVVEGEFDAIVSNPPYVLRKDLMNLDPEISLYEDLRALDGGAEGLDLVLPILNLAGRILPPGAPVFLEVDPCHPHLLPEHLDGDHPLQISQVLQDFTGKDRFIILRKT